MRSSKWGILCLSLIASYASGSPIINSPTATANLVPDVVKRALGIEPSAYTYGSESINEFSWLGCEWRKISKAFGEIINMVVFALREADAKSDIFKRWFDKSNADDVKNVLSRIINLQPPYNAVPQTKDWVLLKEDTHNKCDAGRRAYSVPKLGRFHFCPDGLLRPQMSSIKRADLEGETGATYSSENIKNLAFTMLHEATHWNKIGDAALGTHISDSARTAGNSHLLPGPTRLINAQNYAFLAAEAYMKVRGCAMIDPPATAPGTDDPDDDEITDAKALSIVYYQFANDTAALTSNHWFFFETPVGGTSETCRLGNTALAKFSTSNALVNPKWPGGTFPVKVDGMGCE
ncbi:hypothetical protein CC86DRAFT_465039 [Ophiobolus disseminans]|uniref:Lysine-specific metallo-endopeptidase domain-containing protein n=1 Tax=Ophiobolus disseminans TaxID=1469910 RepID=A0A6A7A8B1_9PLEO|nr:hypothetical protein CC86DRAFT_465039 [Ophiobolus disseminans]